MAIKRQSYRERALVIRSYDFGEADRIVVLLCRTKGLVRGVAKGVRRSKSRFGSRLQPFVELDVQLYPGRNLASITGADTVNYYASGIIEDFAKYSAASTALEAVECLSMAAYDEPEKLFDLTVAVLKDIQLGDSPLLSLDAFLLHAMEMAGWAPSLFACAQCGQAGPHHAFNSAVGGAVCVNCRPPGSTEVDPEVLHIMWLLTQEGDHEAQLHELLTPDRRHSVHALTRSQLQWNLERSLASFNVLDQANLS